MNIQNKGDAATVAYIHIPKTAGTSLVTAINDFEINWCHIPAGIYYKEIDAFLGSYRHSLEQMCNAMGPKHYDLILGHFTACDLIVGCGSAIKFRLATTLRNPIERMISEYFYSISSSHNGRDVILKRFPTFEAWVFENTETEVISRFLESYKGEAAERIASRLLEDFCFVGLTDEFDRSFQRFGQLFGQDHLQTAPKVNVNALTPSRFGDDLLRALRERNARDVELYALVAPKIFARLKQDAR